MATIDSYQTKTLGKLWRVRYRTPDGKQTMERGFKTKRDATQWMNSMEDAKSKGDYVGSAAGRVMLSDLSQRWFDAQVHLKATTRSNYRHSLDKHVLPMWGHRQIASIGHGEVQSWVTLLSRTLSPASVRVPYQTLNSVLRYGVLDGRLARNVCDGVKLPRIVKRKHGYLTHEQVDALATHCKDYGDVVLFLAYTGLRWGEMAALRVKSLNMLRRRIDVSEAVADVRGHIVWGTPKSGEARSVPFPSFLAESLARRCAGKGREDLVFTAPDGGVMRGNNFRKRTFNAAVEALRSEDPAAPVITPHDLRHTAASLAISAGANVKAVQRMLGHADAAMTLNTYADLFDDDLDQVADALDVARRKFM
jgi:integrase